jgi:ABC-type branched-subunit amino acid transport system permease subunit
VASLYNQVPFLVLVIALLVIPRQKLVARGLSGARPIPPIRSFGTRTNAAAAGVAIVVGAFLPFLIPSYHVNQYASGLAFAIIFASLGLLVWMSGQISLCQMAFASVGACTFAHAQARGLSWAAALVVAVLAAIPVGAVVSIPSFRLAGVYLAVATFGFGLLFQNLLYSTDLMFGQFGSVRVSRPDAGGDELSNRGYYYLTLAFLVGVAALILAVRGSRLGRLLRAVSETPAALEAHGVDVRQTRLIVFCLSGAIAALGGALLAGVTGSAGGDASGPFGFFNSLAMIAVLAFCGRRPVASPLIAAFVFEVMKIYPPLTNATVAEYQGVAFGLLAIAVAVFPGIKLPTLTSRAIERRSPARPTRTGPSLIATVGRSA